MNNKPLEVIGLVAALCLASCGTDEAVEPSDTPGVLELEDFGDSFDGSSTTVPQGVEFIPGLAAALAGAEIVNKN